MSERPEVFTSFMSDQFKRDNVDLSVAAHETMEAASQMLLIIVSNLIDHDNSEINGIAAARSILASVRTGWSRTFDIIENAINKAEAEE
jgi:hypothetical protein